MTTPNIFESVYQRNNKYASPDRDRFIHEMQQVLYDIGPAMTDCIPGDTYKQKAVYVWEMLFESTANNQNL